MEKNIWKPKVFDSTWERTKLRSAAKTCTHSKIQKNNLVMCKGVGSNSIFCGECQSWVHKKCSSFKGILKGDPNYRCKRCMGHCRLLDGRPEKHATLEGIQLAVVQLFCYLGDEIFLEVVVNQPKLLKSEQHRENLMNCFLFLHPPQSL